MGWFKLVLRIHILSRTYNCALLICICASPKVKQRNSLGMIHCGIASIVVAAVFEYATAIIRPHAQPNLLLVATLWVCRSWCRHVERYRLECQPLRE